MECACEQFPPSSTVGREPKAGEHGGGTILDEHITQSLVLVGKDRWYSQTWSSASSTAIEVSRILEDGSFYCCRTCGSSFLIVLDKSNEDYLVLVLDPKELGESTPFELRKRFATAFDVQPQARGYDPGS